MGWYKSKVVYHKKLVFRSGVGFLIRCILDHGQCHLVDFWEKFPTDLDFIWIEQISYNSGVLVQIVWSRTSIFKLKSFSTEGCLQGSPRKKSFMNFGSPLSGRGFKFENWGTWPNYLEKYSRNIAILLYSNEIQIYWEISSKIHQMALAMV